MNSQALKPEATRRHLQQAEQEAHDPQWALIGDRQNHYGISAAEPH